MNPALIIGFFGKHWLAILATLILCGMATTIAVQTSQLETAQVKQAKANQDLSVTLKALVRADDDANKNLQAVRDLSKRIAEDDAATRAAARVRQDLAQLRDELTRRIYDAPTTDDGALPPVLDDTVRELRNDSQTRPDGGADGGGSCQAFDTP